MRHVVSWWLLATLFALLERCAAQTPDAAVNQTTATVTSTASTNEGVQTEEETPEEEGSSTTLRCGLIISLSLVAVVICMLLIGFYSYKGSLSFDKPRCAMATAPVGGLVLKEHELSSLQNGSRSRNLFNVPQHSRDSNRTPNSRVSKARKKKKSRRRTKSQSPASRDDTTSRAKGSAHKGRPQTDIGVNAEPAELKDASDTSTPRQKGGEGGLKDSGTKAKKPRHKISKERSFEQGKNGGGKE